MKRDISPQESISITGNAIDISLGHSYVLVEDEIWVSTGIGVAYWNISWKNVEYNITSELSKVSPHGFIGIGGRPLPSLVPGLIVSLSISGTYLPQSYSLTNGIITINDNNFGIKLSPAIEVAFIVPKVFFWPE